MAEPVLSVRRRETVLPMLVLLLGALLRTLHYLEGRGLWSDEVRLAINVTQRSFGGLLHPLAYDQVAPIPFLWITRATVLAAGTSPLAYRLWPFLGSLGLLVGMWALARRLMPTGPALLALAFVAFSPIAIYYAAEFKPYGIDALITVLLVLLAVRVLEAPDEPSRWRQIMAGGVISVICSTSAILVLAALGLGLVAAPAIHRSRTGWRRLLTTGGLWVAAFLPCYFLVYHPGSSSEMMQSGWERHFLTPGSAALGARAEFLARTIVGRFFFISPFGPNDFSSRAALSFCLLLVMGAALLTRRRGLAIAICVTGPILITLLGSAARAYPLWPRLVLFTLPVMAVLAAEATWGIVGLILRQRGRAIAGALVSVALLLPSLATAMTVARRPIHRDESARLMRRFFEESRPAEPIFVAAGTAPSWAFHSTDWTRPDSARLAWLAALGTSGGASFLNHPPRGHAVRHEGWELRRPLGERFELIGIYTGITTTYMPPYPRAVVDSGWADNEADRIMAEGSARVWVLNSELNTPQIDALRTALVARGARERTRYEETGASLSLFEVERPATGGTLATPP